VNNSVAAIVVTYNRRELLEKCLLALYNQLMPLQKIILVDNCSADGTKDMLMSRGFIEGGLIDYIRLEENTGGAGGFSVGLKRGYELGFDWFWLMDDDALPNPDALHEILLVAKNTQNVYGSVAKSGCKTSWILTLRSGCNKFIMVENLEEVPALSEVSSLPFLGFLIHRELVEKIGMPDAQFFISCDDVEYCERAKKAGASIFVAGKSRLEHPKALQTKINIFGHTIYYLQLSPWKRYYDTRNRIILARRHFGGRFFYQTIPGIIVRMIFALMREKDRWHQAKAFMVGIFDGVRGLGGKRHERWNIN